MCILARIRVCGNTTDCVRTRPSELACIPDQVERTVTKVLVWIIRATNPLFIPKSNILFITESVLDKRFIN